MAKLPTTTIGFHTNAVIGIQDRRYVLRPKRCVLTDYDVNIDDKTDSVRPVLILSEAHSNDTAGSILKTIQDLNSRDDVFCADFVDSTLVLQSSELSGTDLDTLKSGLTGAEVLDSHRWNLQSVLSLPRVAGIPSLASGPYFILRNQICEAWKLYEDKLSAFATSIWPQQETPYSFEILNAISPDGYWKSIAVPSRLYKTKTDSKPLAGVRISVKDVYKLRGIQSSLNVRSFLDTYGPETETSTYVKKLIDLGAEIVGKTKTAALAGSEKAPEYWIDFLCPFNPRADGYQVPSGSTSGGAASLAGYDWLDYSLGTDTYGSIRAPAAANGLYGLRCTVGEAVSMDGVYPQCSEFDTLGILARDLSEFHALGKHTFESTISDDEKMPSRIIVPQDFDAKFGEFHCQVRDRVVSGLESSLGIKREVVKFSDVWEKSPPPEAGGKSFQDYFHKSGFYVFYHDAYHAWAQFRHDHEEKFGTKAVVGPHTRFLWDMAAEITDDERSKALEELGVYRRWMNEHFFARSSDDNSSPIILIPQGSTKPDYRDEMTEGIIPRTGVDPNSFGAWLGVPQLVTPVDSVPYLSRISGRDEVLPASVSFLGAKGTDLLLTKVAKAALEKAGIPTTLQTGRTIFK